MVIEDPSSTSAESPFRAVMAMVYCVSNENDDGRITSTSPPCSPALLRNRAIPQSMT